MNSIAAVVAGLSLAFVGTSATIAGTINVNPGESIQAAINAASPGDVINIAAGTYNESNLNPYGKAITIQGTLNGDGTLATTIDAQQSDRVFSFAFGETSATVIQDLIITGGSSSSFGGGIFCIGSSPTISGCTITGNTANAGGGIVCYSDSNPTITDCSITGNMAEASGGGILCYSESSPNISGCTILGNTAFDGGGILCYNESSPIISGCTISDNRAQLGGGGLACLYNCNPGITNCTITINTASDGGGIDCRYSKPTITGCTISGNTAGAGGGINHADSFSNSILADTTVCGNSPDQINGSYTDDGGNTVQEICPLPIGACCTGNEIPCVPNVQEGDCLLWGGQWLGESTSCDADLDGTSDCFDGCPDDPLKTEPGVCGCGTAETNVNGDVDCDGDYDIDDIYAGMANFNITTGTPGDVNADGTVDTSDLDELRTSLELCASDTDMDGDTDIEDLLNVVAGWGTTCP